MLLPINQIEQILNMKADGKSAKEISDFFMLTYKANVPINKVEHYMKNGRNIVDVAMKKSAIDSFEETPKKETYYSKKKREKMEKMENPIKPKKDVPQADVCRAEGCENIRRKNSKGRMEVCKKHYHAEILERKKSGVKKKYKKRDPNEEGTEETKRTYKKHKKEKEVKQKGVLAVETLYQVCVREEPDLMIEFYVDDDGLFAVTKNHGLAFKEITEIR